MSKHQHLTLSRMRIALCSIGLFLNFSMIPAHAARETSRAVPPFGEIAGSEKSPAMAAKPKTSEQEIAVLAGGCFWGVQGVFQHVKGVSNALSGYAGGEAQTAVYQTVGTGKTGHAESVKITFDPRRISYAQLLQIYFSVAHDPTQLDRQGPDTGTQYRSAIFPTTPEQATVAAQYIRQLDESHVFKSPIVTKIEPNRVFYPAENYHQDFMKHHPAHPYIVINDQPKVDDLKRLFPAIYQAD
jgi:peptide-methionine (S)-S-oxide reductase